MCDVGCGSGILSIIAAKKGVGYVEAVEIDHDARISAADNIAKNDCDSSVKLLEKLNQTSEKFDLVVANILFSIILELKDDLISRVKDRGHLIISGITSEENEKLLTAYKDPRIKLLNKEEKDGWMGYVYAAVHDQK